MYRLSNGLATGSSGENLKHLEEARWKFNIVCANMHTGITMKEKLHTANLLG